MYRQKPPTTSVNPSHLIMPFGKFEGKYIYELPRSYLNWLLSQEIDNELRSAVEHTLEFDPPRKGYIALCVLIDVIADLAAKQVISPTVETMMLNMIAEAAKRRTHTN